MLFFSNNTRDKSHLKPSPYFPLQHDFFRNLSHVCLPLFFVRSVTRKKETRKDSKSAYKRTGHQLWCRSRPLCAAFFSDIPTSTNVRTRDCNNPSTTRSFFLSFMENRLVKKQRTVYKYRQELNIKWYINTNCMCSWDWVFPRFMFHFRTISDQSHLSLLLPLIFAHELGWFCIPKWKCPLLWDSSPNAHLWYSHHVDHGSLMVLRCLPSWRF